jgi:hypothetical protein
MGIALTFYSFWSDNDEQYSAPFSVPVVGCAYNPLGLNTMIPSRKMTKKCIGEREMKFIKEEKEMVSSDAAYASDTPKGCSPFSAPIGSPMALPFMQIPLRWRR